MLSPVRSPVCRKCEWRDARASERASNCRRANTSSSHTRDQSWGESKRERSKSAGEDGGPARKPGALLMVLATVPAAYISIEPTEELPHALAPQPS